MTPDKKDDDKTPAETKPAPAKAPAKSGWYHDAGHSETQEREAAQKARDEEFGVGVPPQEPAD